MLQHVTSGLRFVLLLSQYIYIYICFYIYRFYVFCFLPVSLFFCLSCCCADLQYLGQHFPRGGGVLPGRDHRENSRWSHLWGQRTACNLAPYVRCVCILSWWILSVVLLLFFGDSGEFVYASTYLLLWTDCPLRTTEEDRWIKLSVFSWSCFRIYVSMYLCIVMFLNVLRQSHPPLSPALACCCCCCFAFSFSGVGLWSRWRFPRDSTTDPMLRRGKSGTQYRRVSILWLPSFTLCRDVGPPHHLFCVLVWSLQSEVGVSTSLLYTNNWLIADRWWLIKKRLYMKCNYRQYVWAARISYLSVGGNILWKFRHQLRLVVSRN